MAQAFSVDEYGIDAVYDPAILVSLPDHPLVYHDSSCLFPVIKHVVMGFYTN